MSDSPASNRVVDKEKGVPTPLGEESVEVNRALDALTRVQTTDLNHPQHWPVWKKWIIVSIYCLLQVFVTMTSTTYVSVEFL